MCVPSFLICAFLPPSRSPFRHHFLAPPTKAYQPPSGPPPWLLLVHSSSYAACPGAALPWGLGVVCWGPTEVPGLISWGAGEESTMRENSTDALVCVKWTHSKSKSKKKGFSTILELINTPNKFLCGGEVSAPGLGLGDWGIEFPGEQIQPQSNCVGRCPGWIQRDVSGSIV